MQGVQRISEENNFRSKALMKVLVRAFAGFRDVMGERTSYVLPENSDLSALLSLIASRSEESRILLFDDQGRLRGHVILMVNRKRVSRDAIGALSLSDGDEVALYPPVAGG
jgi:molybdopterin synthase sulfur carrier subunit